MEVAAVSPMPSSEQRSISSVSSTASTSSIRDSIVVTRGRSERPMPRVFTSVTRRLLARRSTKGAKCGYCQSHHRLLRNGRKTRSGGPSPTTW
jgi:hypothetical protein